MDEEQRNIAQAEKEVKQSIFNFDELKEELKTGEQVESDQIQGLTVTAYMGEQFIIEINGIPFGKMDEKGVFTYFNLDNAKKEFEHAGLDIKEIDLPQLQQAIDLEEQVKKEQEIEKEQEQEGEKEDEEEKGEELDEEEIADDERDDDKPELEHDDEDVQRNSDWIEIRSDRETDECRTFMGMLKKEYPEYVKGTERLFFAPNPKDANDYKLYVMGKNGKITGEIPLQPTEGRNPMQEDVLQYGRDGGNATTKRPIQMLRIGNGHTGPMVMIYNGTRTDTQIHIGTRSQGDNYQSHMISSSRSQNDIQDARESVKIATSSTLNERTDGDAEENYYQVLKSLEKQNVPENVDPAKDEDKISDVEVENFECFKISFARALMEEYGINKECAAYVTIEVLENGKDFNKTLDEAIQILDGEKQKEEKGTIPKGSADRSAGKYYTDRLNPKQEDLEEELGRGDPRSH